jgi:hypothetical protein
LRRCPRPAAPLRNRNKTFSFPARVAEPRRRDTNSFLEGPPPSKGDFWEPAIDRNAFTELLAARSRAARAGLLTAWDAAQKPLQHRIACGKRIAARFSIVRISMRGSRRTRFSNARLGSRRLRLKAPTTPACQPGVTRQAAGLLPSAPLRSDWANISQIPVWSQCTSQRLYGHIQSIGWWEIQPRDAITRLSLAARPTISIHEPVSV